MADYVQVSPHSTLSEGVCGRAVNTLNSDLDLEVRGSSLARRVDSLDKELILLCLSSPRCVIEYR